MTRGLTITTLLTVLAIASCQQNARRKPPAPPVTAECLECICQASSDCNTKLRCHNAGNDAYYCGAFVANWAYWHDGGRPGDHGRAHDFENCLNNRTCAEQTVRGYMKKHGQDCDGNGIIDCYDFARIHKMGPGSCDSDDIDNTDYWEKFLVCQGADYDSAGYGYQNQPPARDIDARDAYVV